jgi:protein phosphatase
MPGSNMGTTLSCVHVGEKETSYAWMGDSRIYLADAARKQLIQLSTDHTVYQEMLERGEVGQGFNKHILSRMLGNNPYTRPDGDRSAVSRGDVLLVCSDGFSDMVTEETMLAILAQTGDDLESGLDQLVEFAKGQGGLDNITVVLAEVA